MRDFMISQIRTYVPVGVGALISWLLSLGINVGEQGEVGLIAFGTAAVTGAYYTAARAIEKKWPIAGRFLLGSKLAPQYPDPSGGGIQSITLPPSRYGD